MQGHIERGDDAKVAAASANGPVEVGVLVGAGLHEASVGKDQFCGQYVVAAEAVRAHQRAHATAKKKAADTHRRTLAENGGESCFGGFDLNRAAQHASSEASRTLVGRNRDAAEAGHIHHDAAIAGGVAGITGSSAADSKGQITRGGEGEGRVQVLWVDGMDDEGGMRVTPGGVSPAQLLVAGIAGAEDASSQFARKGGEVARTQRRGRRELLSQGGLCKKRERGAKALPEKRTAVHGEVPDLRALALV